MIVNQETSGKYRRRQPDDACSDTVIGSVLSMNSPNVSPKVHAESTTIGVKVTKRTKKSSRNKDSLISADNKVNCVLSIQNSNNISEQSSDRLSKVTSNTDNFGNTWKEHAHSLSMDNSRKAEDRNLDKSKKMKSNRKKDPPAESSKSDLILSKARISRKGQSPVVIDARQPIHWIPTVSDVAENSRRERRSENDTSLLSLSSKTGDNASSAKKV